MLEQECKWIVSVASDPEVFEPAKDWDGRIIYFDSLEDIIAAMKDGGATDEEILKARVWKSSGVCKRCGHPLFKSSIDGYKYQCFNCDEDFYGFEQEEN